MQFCISRLPSASVYWRNELRLGPLVAHHQTVFVTAGQLQRLRPRRLVAAPLVAATAEPRRVLVVQGRAPTVMRLRPVATAAAYSAASLALTCTGDGAGRVTSPGKFNRDRSNPLFRSLMMMMMLDPSHFLMNIYRMAFARIPLECQAIFSNFLHR